MKKFIKAVFVIILLLGISGVVCYALFGGFAEFKVNSCASGFYFNRSAKLSYTIKELGVKSESNYFYLEDYFYSEELGQEYTVKGRLLEVGKVYLAKKSEHYNQERFVFDIVNIDADVITITKEMNYVEITSSSPAEEIDMHIQIEGRELPLDLTLNNVNIRTEKGVPVIISSAFTDINVILKGENSLRAGGQKVTLNELIDQIKNNKLSEQEKKYYDMLNEVEYAKDTFEGKNSMGDVSFHYFDKLNKYSMKSIDKLLDGVGNVLGGKEGAEGADGSAAFIHPCGISFSGEGSLYLLGGAGGKGGDASISLIGQADGGDGGAGGEGLVCGALLDLTGNLEIEGGWGGIGGEPSKGLMGSMGSTGAKGKNGESVSVANPRREK